MVKIYPARDIENRIVEICSCGHRRFNHDTLADEGNQKCISCTCPNY